MTLVQDETTEQTANKNYILYGSVPSILKKRSVSTACVYVYKICHTFLQRFRWSSGRWLLLNFLN